MTPARRTFDILCAGTGLLVLAPALGLIALAIKLGDGGSVLFRQVRIGKGGRPFRILKFRSMSPRDGAADLQVTVHGDARITPVGRWLRRTKIDELPQLLNVLHGEMTLVGPRPEVPRYVALYDDKQRPVLDLVPGLTDPASIAYRNEESILKSFEDPERGYIDIVMPEKIRLNLEYASRRTLLADIGVVIRTFLSLWRAA